MSRYPAPELSNLPEDIRAKVLEVQAKAGFVPNVFLALARRPVEWRAFFCIPRRADAQGRRLMPSGKPLAGWLAQSCLASNQIVMPYP